MDDLFPPPPPSFLNNSWAFLGVVSLPDGKEESEHNGEDPLDVGPGREAEDAEDEKLRQLAGREGVDAALGHALDVVVGRVGGLLRDQ